MDLLGAETRQICKSTPLAAVYYLKVELTSRLGGVEVIISKC